MTGRDRGGPPPGLPVFQEWMGFQPYGSRDGCWGCGLTPHIRTGDQWHPYLLCRYCAELRTLVLGDRFDPPSASMNPAATIAPAFTDEPLDPAIIEPDRPR